MRELGTPHEWQAILDDAASMRLLRSDLEHAGVELYEVTQVSQCSWSPVLQSPA